MERTTQTLLLLILVLSLPAVTYIAPQSKPDHSLFVLSSWDYPDEYGQGIDAIRLWQYLSGSWQSLTPFDYGNTGNDTFVISETGPLTVQVKGYVNATHVGASTLAEGQNYVRHSALVTTPSNISVFSLQNFTYVTATDSLSPMFYYFYNATLNFTPQPATIYTCEITMETARPIFSSENSTASQVWKWKNDVSSWVDDTADFNSITAATDVVPLQNPPTQNDSYYFGSDTKFTSMWINITQAGDHTAYLRWEYYNGTGWSELTNGPTGYQETLEVSGMQLFSWDMPYNWTQVSVNGETYYYIRIFVESGQNQMMDNCQATHGFLNFVTWNWSQSGYVDTAQEMTLIFDSPVSTSQLWTLNAWYIVLGMILVPASGLYLVYGGRKNLSSDKVFYALIAFMIGWGLIVGGILP